MSLRNPSPTVHIIHEMISGRPCRGFLEGRVDGEKYQLMLHLSDMELKRAAPKGE
jgi:hypothetical protein